MFEILLPFLLFAGYLGGTPGSMGPDDDGWGRGDARTDAAGGGAWDGGADGWAQDSAGSGWSAPQPAAPPRRPATRPGSFLMRRLGLDFKSMFDGRKTLAGVPWLDD